MIHNQKHNGMKKNALLLALCSLFSSTKDEKTQHVEDNMELRKFYLPLLEEGVKQFAKKHRIGMDRRARQEMAILMFYQNIVLLQHHFPQRISASVLLKCDNIVMWRNRDVYFEIVTVSLEKNGSRMRIVYSTEKGRDCQTDTIALTK